MNREKIFCIKCKKIIMEGELKYILKEIGNDEYIECPYCFEQYKNPYRK